MATCKVGTVTQPWVGVGPPLPVVKSMATCKVGTVTQPWVVVGPTVPVVKSMATCKVGTVTPITLPIACSTETDTHTSLLVVEERASALPVPVGTYPQCFGSVSSLKSEYGPGLRFFF